MAGGVAATLLDHREFVGFVLQALPYVGVHQSNDASAARRAGAAATVGGVLVAALAIPLVKGWLRK